VAELIRGRCEQLLLLPNQLLLRQAALLDFALFLLACLCRIGQQADILSSNIGRGNMYHLLCLVLLRDLNNLRHVIWVA
jgi:hypothetical protein